MYDQYYVQYVSNYRYVYKCHKYCCVLFVVLIILLILIIFELILFALPISPALLHFFHGPFSRPERRHRILLLPSLLLRLHLRLCGSSRLSPQRLSARAVGNRHVLEHTVHLKHQGLKVGRRFCGDGPH